MDEVENILVEGEEEQSDKTPVFKVRTKAFHYVLAAKACHSDLVVKLCSTCLLLSVRLLFGRRVYWLGLR